MKDSRVLLAAALAVAFFGCTSQSEPAETTAASTTSTSTTSTTEAPAAAGPAVDLVAFSDHLYGVEGLAPAGWNRVEYGVLLRGDSATDATLLVQQAAPAGTTAQIMSAMVAQLELGGPPAAAGTI